MSLIVQKFGGTSVADTDSLRIVAERIIDCKKNGNDVVVVPSAMGSSTDELIQLANDLSENPTPREIKEITGERVKEGLENGDIVIVAGFQGFNRDTKEITTLGRGGSDATAVALAAALGAERCEIFTDVEGVFTADPRVVNSAELIPEITYEEMLEMASSGAGVLMARSVEFGRRYGGC